MSTTAVPGAALPTLAGGLKVRGEPNRRRIRDLLIQGEQCNCRMGATRGRAPNLISPHLSVLHRAGRVHLRRNPAEARWIHHSINRRDKE
jgi:hypothetical protein